MAKWLGLPPPDEYQGLKVKDLPLNHAYIVSNTSFEGGVGVYTVRDDCHNCPFKLVKYLNQYEEYTWMVDRSVVSTWRLLKEENKHLIPRDHRRGHLCEMRPILGEYGVYRLDVGFCNTKEEVAPTFTYTPLLLTILFLLSSYIVYGLVRYLLKWIKERRNGEQSVLTEKKDCDNFRSLFFYRGLLTIFMVFVTSGGGGYPVFANDWNGLSMAEYLYYFYIWTVGVNVPLLTDRAFVRQTKMIIVRNVFLRSSILFLVGALIDFIVGSSTKPTLWFPLERLAIAYFISAMAYVLTVQRYEMKSKMFLCKIASNLVSMTWCWVIGCLLLAATIIIMLTFASVNCLANTDLHNSSAVVSKILMEETQNCNNNFTEIVNSVVVGEYKRIINVNYYLGFSRGILGVLSTTIHMMIGLKTGLIFLRHTTTSDRLKLWGFWSSIFFLGGFLFAGLTYVVEFNLWPIATILFTSSVATYIFIIFYVLIEVCHLPIETLADFGTTSLVILCGHFLLSNYPPLSWKTVFDSHILYLVQNYWIILVWFLIGYSLAKKKIRFSI